MKTNRSNTGLWADIHAARLSLYNSLSLNSDQFDGLILIGTSHPKEEAFDLSNTSLSVTKIYASNDGLASVEEVKVNATYLPDDTNWVLIEGGNHGQFGYYGAQLGDNSATISREQQQKLTVEAVLTALNSVQGSSFITRVW